MVRSPFLVALAGSLALAGCMVGPTYHRPSVATSPAYKEAGDWTPAQPSDALDRGSWWTLFNDPALNDLEARVEVSNQNLAAAEAAYRQASAAVAETGAALLPTVDLTGSAGRGKGGTSGPATKSAYRASVGGAWAVDVWGGIRRQLQGARAKSQASAASLANARLSAQAQLAAAYLQLRAADEQKRLLDETTRAYDRNVTIVRNRYAAGVAPKGDLLTAQSQLANAQASAIDYGRQRAILEHAIAVLTGQAPASFALSAAPSWTPAVPDVPVGLPSTLLQRRPDIASAERLVANANAQIGVQTAAFFPSLTLSGSDGFSAGKLTGLIAAPNNAWSVGADVAETLFNGGARIARVREAHAAYDQAVAQYRQTVLTAFQQVEDALAASRILAQEQAYRLTASQNADQAERIAQNQYLAGQADYTTVVVAQAAALNARQALVSAEQNRLTTAVSLIEALGGGWNGKL